LVTTPLFIPNVYEGGQKEECSVGTIEPGYLELEKGVFLITRINNTVIS